jgi:hypothetical protein
MIIRTPCAQRLAMMGRVACLLAALCSAAMSPEQQAKRQRLLKYKN